VKRIAILGSTGSIGVQALDVVARFPDRFEIVGLAAGRNAARLVEQVRRFRPKIVSVSDEATARELRAVLPAATEVRSGDEGAVAIAVHPDVDLVLAAIAGGAGLRSTAAAMVPDFDGFPATVHLHKFCDESSDKSNLQL
jgi:1-deoxy-D-xylulose-5-phosphate reductoisomerase